MKKQNLPKVGFAIIMMAFVYLTVNLLMHNVRLNLATWSMWVVIAIVSAGNKRPWSMVVFETGACTITLIALVKLTVGHGRWSWGSTESITAICVVLALIVWKLTSDNKGVISIPTAMYIAMIPTFADQWSNPDGQDPWFWGACSLGCALELIGKPKTISQAFFPACGAIANGLAAILSARRFFM